MEAANRMCISFDGEGNPVVLDESGNPAEPKIGNLNDFVGDGKIVEAGSIPFVKVKGSCYIWVCINGRWYQIPC